MLQVNIFLLVICIFLVNCNSAYSVAGFSFFPITEDSYKDAVESYRRDWGDTKEEAEFNAHCDSCLCLPFTGTLDCVALPFRLLYFAGKEVVTKVQANRNKRREVGQEDN